MVEGPGCKVKGEIMKKRILNKTVIDVNRSFPNRNDQRQEQNADACINQYALLRGHLVADVRTLGKELFIFFVDCAVCVRIHFLMEGSVRYGEIKDLNSRLSSQLTLVILLTDEKLSVFKSAVDLRPVEASVQHCNALADLDICSPLFDYKRAEEMVKEKHSELICDVIMDQVILPGVGNIIKNEGLFKSGINPNTTVSELSPVLISCLIHRLRDFSAVFYMCRKNNKPLAHHLCIYEKRNCSQCSGKVTVCKPGALGRLTFYCSVCQVNSSSSSEITLPKKNSILGFLRYSKTSNAQDDPWECSRCTFMNQEVSLSCEMCSEKPFNRKRKSSKSDSVHESNTKSRKVENIADGNGSTTENTIMKQHEDEAFKDLFPDSKLVPKCPGHGKECVTRTVTRTGDNKGRLFFCCSQSSRKQCKFFQWADLHHPTCAHGKRTILRRVLKQNDNNGKEFFSCPLSKNNQCNFFQWAVSR